MRLNDVNDIFQKTVTNAYEKPNFQSINLYIYISESLEHIE